VQLTAGKDTLLGHADLFDLFQVEEPPAIGKGVQGHDAERWGLGVEQG
jgi:hypothetical protein